MPIDLQVIRACLLYEFKLGSNASEACRRICSAFGNDVVKRRTAQKWFARFGKGDESLEDAPRSGRPSDINDKDLQEVIEKNSNLSCQDLAQIFNVSDETCRSHLHGLGKSWKLSKWVPHSLTTENKLMRKSICSSHISRHQITPFLDFLLTSDEKWIYLNNNKRSHHWLSTEDPIPHSPKKLIHSPKIMLCVWWNITGIVHYEFLNHGQTVTSALYVEQLERVQHMLLQKQPALINRKKVVFLHDNAKPHIAKFTREKISALNWEILPHPPYSPDISPTDYHLFLSLDNHIRGKQFKNREEVKLEVDNFFASKDKDFYKKGIYKLLSRWRNVLNCEGDYFD